MLAFDSFVNPLNADLNPTCHLLAVLGAHRTLHVSRIRVKKTLFSLLCRFVTSEFLLCPYPIFVLAQKAEDCCGNPNYIHIYLYVRQNTPILETPSIALMSHGDGD